MGLDWADAVEQAGEATGYAGEVVPRAVEPIRAHLRAGRHREFDLELGALSQGGAFEAFLDHWWTQALADTALDADARELAVEFADLAIALRVRSEGGPTYTSAEVEQMLTRMVS
ncbi:hypothetical protein ACH4UR_25250 [Streptomyces lydicus]|uniref:hypothetical protein n=1 Tax=Streptomyces lydicus TaxID=47763 RepID=UPI0034003A75